MAQSTGALAPAKTGEASWHPRVGAGQGWGQNSTSEPGGPHSGCAVVVSPASAPGSARVAALLAGLSREGASGDHCSCP